MKSKRNVILREKVEPVEVIVEEELENAAEEAVEETVEEAVEENVEEAVEETAAEAVVETIEEEPAVEEVPEETSEEEPEEEEVSEEPTEEPEDETTVDEEPTEETEEPEVDEESSDEEDSDGSDDEEVVENSEEAVEETEVEETESESAEEIAEEISENVTEEETEKSKEPVSEDKTKKLPYRKHSIEKEKSKRIRGIIAEILIMLLLGGAVLGAMIKISAPPEENKNIDKAMVHVVGMGNVWLRQGEDWVYLQADRTYATGWVQIPPTDNSPNDKEWCYFDEDGIFVNSYNEKDEPSKKQIPITKGNLIVINLSSQLLYLYNKGECVFCTNIISGRSGFDTPTGEYTIRAKATNVSLKGESEGEKWDSHVTFWMPFIGGAVGIHDATWQPEWKFQDPSSHYGGGSHGCVNMRYGDAAALFNMIDVGTKVVVQY